MAVAITVAMALPLGVGGALGAIDQAAPRIVGGAEVDPALKYPFMAALVTRSNPNAFAGQLCGGAVISPYWVLTAAHCVSVDQGADEIDVVVGRHDLTANDGERIAVARVLRHPAFDVGAAFLEFDVALLRLSAPTSFSPIRLASPTNAADYGPGTTATTMGWGSTESSPLFPGVLHEVDLPVISDVDCEAAGAPGSPYAPDFDGTSMLCAGYPSGGHDTCQGDSGGPLVVPDNVGGWLHIGIVSWGTGCAIAGAPSVYAETAASAAWVDSVLAGPLAADDVANATAGVPIAIDVLANDSEPSGAVLTISQLSQPAHGVVSLGPGSNVTYTAHDGLAGVDSFTYVASNGQLESEAATVTINVSYLIASVGVHKHGVGLIDPTQGVWTLRNGAGVLNVFYFGNPGDVPFLGDWNCDGTETPGLFRPSDGYVYLRLSNTEGPADINFYAGNPDDVPLAGDFNNDGCDTVSLYRSAQQTFFIFNRLGANGVGIGAADRSFEFGNLGDTPFVGDFDGDGMETVGVHRRSSGEIWLTNSDRSSTPDLRFFFGDGGDRLVAGDWTGDGTFTPGVFRPSIASVYLRNANQEGMANAGFRLGESHWLPVAGAF